MNFQFLFGIGGCLQPIYFVPYSWNYHLFCGRCISIGFGNFWILHPKFFLPKKTSIFFSKKKSCNFSFFLQEFKHFDFNVISIKIVIVTAMWNLLVYCFKEMPTDNWSWQGSHCSKRHLSSFIMRISHSLFRSKESY